MRATKEVLGWDPDAALLRARRRLRALQPVDRGASAQAEWERALRAVARRRRRAAPSEWDAAWDRAARCPGSREALPTSTGARTSSPRARAGQKAMAAFSRLRPDDGRRRRRPVSESTKTEFPRRRRGALHARPRAAATSSSACASTAWAASVNGMAAHGGIVRPYGSTFLQFADYMRGSIRLSALTGLQVAWVYTHDSVGLGEDGPTHQPVEHLAALRAIPGLVVLRPGDANETARGVARDPRGPRGPGGARRSRARTCRCSADASRRRASRSGAYVLRDAEDDERAIARRHRLRGLGRARGAPSSSRPRASARASSRCRAGSCSPQQDEAYRDAVLPPDAAEASRSRPASRWAGRSRSTRRSSIDRFGACAPAPRSSRSSASPRTTRRKVRELLAVTA